MTRTTIRTKGKLHPAFIFEHDGGLEIYSLGLDVAIHAFSKDGVFLQSAYLPLGDTLEVTCICE